MQLNPKFALLLVLPFLGSCSTTMLSVYTGERTLEENSPADEQTAVGLELLWGVLPWGLGLEVGGSTSSEDQGGADVELMEVYVGARKTFREDERLRPYIGAGLSYVEGDVNGVDDGSEAYYGHVGMAYHFALFHVGLDYRVVTGAEADLGGASDVDLDSGTAWIVFGLSF